MLFVQRFLYDLLKFLRALFYKINGEKELQEEKTFSIFIQTDYVNTK